MCADQWQNLFPSQASNASGELGNGNALNGLFFGSSDNLVGSRVFSGELGVENGSFSVERRWTSCISIIGRFWV